MPLILHAEGISLLGDFTYDYTNNTDTNKVSGTVIESDVSRFSQLYQLDMRKTLYPNLRFNLGSYFERDTSDSETSSTGETDLSSDLTERAFRPYVEARLNNPLYNGSLWYRKSDEKTGGSFLPTEKLQVDRYGGNLNWRPVDLPQVSFNYSHQDVQDDPLTRDSTSDIFALRSKYAYKDYLFRYNFASNDIFDNITDSGSRQNSHIGDVSFSRPVDYKNNRFNVDAGARINYNSAERTGGESSVTVDSPASELGTQFYIINDSPPTSSQPFDLVLVDGGNPLTNINIGRSGGINPVSAGLAFNTPTEVETIYIELSQDTESFPDLASPSQISAIASSFVWQCYSSDDQTELNWTAQPIASSTYNQIDNRFEIRLAASVSIRRIKITTIPLSLVAPGEIRYNSIRAFVTLAPGSEKRENIDQRYSFGLAWSPGTDTSVGYSVFFRDQETKPSGASRNTWNNSLYFRHTLNRIYSMHGGINFDDRQRTTPRGTEEENDRAYSLGFKGVYLDTLSQSLLFSRSESSGRNFSDKTNSALLRTTADLYEGWSANLDLRYSIANLDPGDETTSKELGFSTMINPNPKININLNYSIEWSDGLYDTLDQYGTLQFSYVLTETLNMFFRYSIADQQGGPVERTDSFREFSINWNPFPEGDMHFSIGYYESLNAQDQKIKSISPLLTWKLAGWLYLDLEYSRSTIDDAARSIDSDRYTASLRMTY